jgi:hypothetical protein
MWQTFPHEFLDFAQWILPKLFFCTVNMLLLLEGITANVIHSTLNYKIKSSESISSKFLVLLMCNIDGTA